MAPAIATLEVFKAARTHLQFNLISDFFLLFVEPKTVATLVLAVRCSESDFSARPYPHSRPDLIHRLDLIHTRLDLIYTRLDLIHTRLDLIHTFG